MMMTEEERYDTERPGICECLRWKGMFVQSEPDPSVPSGRANQFWCVFTQTVVGPDGQVVEPVSCMPGRVCFGTGKTG